MRHAAAARARARRPRTGAHRGGRGGRNARHHGAAVAWCARHTRKGNVRQHACRHRRKARENYTRDGRGASKVRSALGVSAALKRGADTERQSLRKDTCCCGAKETAAEPHTCAPVVQAAATDRAAGRAACVRLAGGTRTTWQARTCRAVRPALLYEPGTDSNAAAMPSFCTHELACQPSTRVAAHSAAMSVRS